MERLPPAVVVADEEAVTDCNPLRNYLRCLADPPKGATHMTILQDDVLPCDKFVITLKERIAERPADLISLFVGGLSNPTRKHFLQAAQRGERWSRVWFRDIHHVVALVWPVALAAEFLKWFETTHIPGPQPPRSDDAVVGYWARTSKPRRTFWATVPCLVEHPDDVPSVAQLRRGGTGSDRGRRAIWFADSSPV